MRASADAIASCCCRQIGTGSITCLDRTTGEFLLGKPFVKKLTWASGIDKNGRPELVEGNKPTRAGTVPAPLSEARRTGTRPLSIRTRGCSM